MREPSHEACLSSARNNSLTQGIRPFGTSFPSASFPDMLIGIQAMGLQGVGWCGSNREKLSIIINIIVPATLPLQAVAQPRGCLAQVFQLAAATGCPSKPAAAPLTTLAE